MVSREKSRLYMEHRVKVLCIDEDFVLQKGTIMDATEKAIKRHSRSGARRQKRPPETDAIPSCCGMGCLEGHDRRVLAEMKATNPDICAGRDRGLRTIV